MLAAPPSHPPLGVKYVPLWVFAPTYPDDWFGYVQAASPYRTTKLSRSEVEEAYR